MKKYCDNMIRKLKVCAKSNEGFTMVELLSSLAIFAFFTVALLQYMTTAATVNSHVSTSVSLSMQSQVALGFIEEYLIDSSGIVEFDADSTTGDAVLYVVNNYDYSGDFNPTVYAFKFVAGNNTLYYCDAEVDREPVYNTYVDEHNITQTGTTLISYNYKFASASPWSGDEIIAQNIDSFDVHLNVEEVQITSTYNIDKVSSVEIFFGMSLGHDDYEGNSFISLRNTPLYSESSNSKLLYP